MILSFVVRKISQKEPENILLQTEANGLSVFFMTSRYWLFTPELPF